MDTILNIINFINDNILWGIPLIIAILGTGIFISIRMRFLQVRKFKESMSSTFIPTVKSIGKKKEKDSLKDASHEAKKASESLGIKFSTKLGWLNKMLWGGSVMLIVDHAINGELFTWMPLEILKVGVPMCLVLTAVWAVWTILTVRGDARSSRA